MNEAIQGLVAGESGGPTGQALYTLFQPIIDGATREPIGHEALTRGPEGPLELPAALIAAAAAAGLSISLERCCLESALRAYRSLGLQGRLFLNLLPQNLLDWAGLADWLGRQLAAHQIDPHDVVLEVTEHGLTEDEVLLANAVAPLRALGCDIAIDDLGAGSSGLKTWAAIRPDYVKVDRYFVSGIEEDAVRGEILRSVVDMGRVTGCRVIAEGIENREQYALLLELGVDYLQGYLLGRTFDLLRQITAQQIQAARHCNPLTGLPGNREIQRHLAQWLARRRHFVACHLDLDHFKAFNDTYGYARGDQVLLHVSQVITQIVRPRVDFVGHVGGDDFVFLMRSQDWTLRLIAIIEELAASLINFHSLEHREAGGHVGIDRHGTTRHFPLLSASIAAFEVDGARVVSADVIAESLRQTKTLAKAKPGCSCLLAAGDRVIDLVSRVEPVQRMTTQHEPAPHEVDVQTSLDPTVELEIAARA